MKRDALIPASDMRLSPVTYRVLAGAAVLATAALLIVGHVSERVGSALPLQFRLVRARLSHLPVEFSNLRSCSCWAGLRDQAERKYKFKIVNRSDDALRIAGGDRSIIRLVVAYPQPQAPRLTVPDPQPGDERGSFDSPPDKRLRIATRAREVRPSQVIGANADFGVPAAYSVWALPPLRDGVIERRPDGDGTYATVVDKPVLLPGEGYSSERRGHGAWVFNIPLQHSFAVQIAASGDDVPAFSRQEYERYLRVIGLAAFRVESDGQVQLIGFAPTPSDDALRSPKVL